MMNTLSTGGNAPAARDTFAFAIARRMRSGVADDVGLKAQVAAITERAMRGEIAFEPALRRRLRGIVTHNPSSHPA